MATDYAKICDILKHTKKPDEFVGTCMAIQEYTGNSLETFVKYNVIELLLELFIQKDILQRFIIRESANLLVIEVGIRKMCLDTLSSLIVCNDGFERLNKYLKNESKRSLFVFQIKTFIEVKKCDVDEKTMNAYKNSMIKSLYGFLTNVCIFDPINIDLYDMKSLVGDEKYSCLDEKTTDDVLLKKIFLAFNYYGTGMSITKLEEFTDAIGKRQLSKNVRVSLVNLITASSKALKNTSLRKKLKKLIK